MNKTVNLFKTIINDHHLSIEDENVKALLDILEAQNDASNKPELTPAGMAILEYLQSCDKTSLKARDIAEGMNLPSRRISGSIRKLVDDGFVDKMGKDPVIYSITEKGKNFDINNYKENMDK